MSHSLKSNLYGLLSIILSILTTYFFFIFYKTPIVYLITAEWTVAFLFLSLVNYIASLTPQICKTTRKEELIFLTARLLFLIPFLVTLFSYTTSKLDFIFVISSTLVMCIIFLSIDKKDLDMIVSFLNERI